MPWYIASSFRSFHWNEGCVRKYSPFDAMRRYLLHTHFILFVKIANAYALLMGMSLKKSMFSTKKSLFSSKYKSGSFNLDARK